jgi:non-specific protein-tyrosine kinase
VELKQYFQVIWRWLWLIVACVLLSGGVAFQISRLLAPTYAATTTALVPTEAAFGNAGRNYDDLLASQLLANTYADLMSKSPVLESVVANLQLDVTPRELAAKLKATVNPDTRLIVLTVEDANPQRAADIANEIIKMLGATVQAQREASYANARRSLEADAQTSQQDLNRTQAEIDALKDATTGPQLAERRRLELELSQHRSNYAALLEAMATLRLADPQIAESLRVVEVANPNPIPVRPNVLLNTLVAGLVGAMLAVGAAFLVALFDDTLRSAEDVERRTSTALLAQIRSFHHGSSDYQLIVSTAPRSAIAENFRLLRTNIDIALGTGAPQAIAVTSCDPEAGSSTVVANLAIAFAQIGRRVLVVDANLYNPAQHSLFDQPNSRGLTTALKQRDAEPVKQYLLQTDIEHLLLLPSGKHPAGAADLLAGADMKQLISQLRSQVDVVLLDTPPLGVVVDALPIARACDAALIVARAGVTKSGSLVQVTEQLETAGVRLLGAVLNRVKGGGPGPYDNRGRRHPYQSAHPGQHEADASPSLAQLSGDALPSFKDIS